MLQTYEIVYEIFFFISFLGLVIGLFDPNIVLFWSETRTRKRVLIMFGVASVVFIILTSVVISLRNDQRKKFIIRARGVLTEECSQKSVDGIPMLNA